jgi:hypothetical protein
MYLFCVYLSFVYVSVGVVMNLKEFFKQRFNSFGLQAVGYLLFCPFSFSFFAPPVCVISCFSFKRLVAL